MNRALTPYEDAFFINLFHSLISAGRFAWASDPRASCSYVLATFNIVRFVCLYDIWPAIARASSARPSQYSRL